MVSGVARETTMVGLHQTTQEERSPQQQRGGSDARVFEVDATTGCAGLDATAATAGSMRWQRLWWARCDGCRCDLDATGCPGLDATRGRGGLDATSAAAASMRHRPWRTSCDATAAAANSMWHGGAIG
ncbi:Os02g0652850 [Oryza sativa Japonica Group]|uniref:Os02g0652850 protein n=4 Tax=Oryza TaxID=4527 RepID=B9F1E8_ORYSJ|nr:hypothetical protein OsJ_07764 [Oryza sativa Japonica Group]BAS80072.1 Os02g0652850 [Oryza sativa Japonica Group]